MIEPDSIQETEQLVNTGHIEESPDEFTDHKAKTIRLSWEFGLLCAITTLAVVSRLYHLGLRTLSYDESLHAYFSYLYAIGKGYIQNPMMHGPVLFEATGFLDRLFGASDFTTRLFPAITGIILVVLIPRLFKKWLGVPGALATSVFLLISPYILYYSRYIRHDLIVIFWFLLAILVVFRYLDRKQEADILLLAVVLALMFSTMEIAFMYLAILTLYLVLRIVWFYRFHWLDIRHSAEFELAILLITLGALFSSPIALPVLNPIWKITTGKIFIDIHVFNTQSFARWETGQTGVRLLSVWIIFAATSALTGILLLGRVWMKAALIFLTITIALFTTFFNNPGGLWTGTIGSLGYWLSQQAVARGSQPWYYFLIVFPLYEYLPFMGGIIATVYYCIIRKGLDAKARQFVFFLIFWCASISITLTFAGEKMPWLSTHLTVPFIFLTGWLTGQLLGKNWSWVGGTRLKAGRIAQAAGLSFIALFSIFTLRTAYLSSYVNYDYTTEYIDYAHGAPGDKWLGDDLTRIVSETSSGQNISIITDNGIAWPLAWYLRNFQHLQYYQHGKPDSRLMKSQVIIAGLEDWTKVEAILGSQYDVFQVIRIWWPLEDYRGLTWERISYALTNPEMRSAIWQIVWNRDYRLYAQLTHQTINPPAEWPLNQPMRIYIRKDLIGEIPGGINSLELAPALVLQQINSP